MKPPEHPLGTAFQKARGWEADQERRLTEPQREAFAELKKIQAKSLEKARKQLDTFRTKLAERAKNQRPKAELNYNPPILTEDIYKRREARAALAALKRIDTLERQHEAARTALLKKYERQRNAPDMADAWAKAVGKASRDEKAREPKDKTNERTKDLER